MESHSWAKLLTWDRPISGNIPLNERLAMMHEQEGAVQSPYGGNTGGGAYEDIPVQLYPQAYVFDGSAAAALAPPSAASAPEVAPRPMITQQTMGAKGQTLTVLACAQDGKCHTQCLQAPPCPTAPALAPAPVLAPAPAPAPNALAHAPAPAPQQLIVQQTFTAKRKYQPAAQPAPTLAASAPGPVSSLVCTCSSSDQGIRAGPVITFEYAGVCTKSALLQVLSLHTAVGGL